MSDPIDLALARELRATTGTTRPLERAARRRELIRVQPGAYLPREAWERARDEERHRFVVAAVRARAATEPVFSHESAAALHGIPIVGDWPRTAIVTVPPTRASTSAAVTRVRRVLSEADVMTLADGSRVTSPERTVIDIAAQRRGGLAAVVAISAIRNGGVALDQIEDVMARAGRMSGIRAARAAVAASTAGSESPLETLVLVRCRDLGFAEPEQQRVVRGADGLPYRVDFAWRDGAILGEADGKLKYRGEPGRPTPREVLWAEKRREDALRARGARLVRLAWEDAWDGVGLAARLVEAGVPRVRMPRRVLTW